MGVLVVESEAADPWIPPPPKKKWIRHYLRGEIPKDYTTFSSSTAAELSPLASSPPSPPSVQVPAPPQNHLPTTNGLCSYSPPSSSASSSPPPPPIAYSRPLPSPPPPPPHPTPPADTHLPPLREDTPPPLPQYLSSSSSPLRIPPHHHALPVSSLQPPPPLPSSSSSSTTAPILHNHLHQHQLHQQQQQRPPSPRSACTSPSSSSSVSVPSSSSAATHNPPFHDFQAADGGYAGVKSEDGDGSSGGGVGSGGGAISSSSSPSRTFRRITVSSQLARLEEAQELRRRVGSGTREVHNKLEKNRRAHLKECFELLKKQLPASQDEKKSSNLSILHSALRYIQSLKRKERDYEHEMERLAREKIASQQRLSALKKELSAQWDHIDFNALLPPDSVLSATGGGASPRRAPEDEEEEEREDSVMGADGGNSSFGDRMRSRKELGLPITSDHNSNSTSTASERGHLSDDVEDVLPYRSNVPFPRGPPLLLCHSLPPGGGKRSPRPIHGGSTPASPTPPPPPPQRSSVLQQHRLASPSATPPSSLPASPTHTPPPRTLAAPGSPRPSRRLSPTRQMLLPEMHHQHPEEVGIAVSTIPTAHVHVPAQVVRAPPGLATALVSPGTAIHLLTTSSHNHQRHHIPGLYQTTAHGPHLQQLRVPTTSSTSTSTSPKAASPISSNNSSPSSPLLLGSPSQQPLALTVHAHPATNHHFHHSSQVVSVPHKCRDQDSKTPAVSSTTSATAISVPTIHLAGKVVQHSMAFLGPPTTTTAPGASELSHDLEGAITSSSSGKYGSPQHHHLQQQPAVAITGGSITLPNGVVAHASSANAGVAITQAVSPTNSARGSLPTSLTLAHSPTSAGGTTTMLTTAIHGAGTTPISALPTHLTQAGITHLVAPIGGGHAALVTTSGAGAGAHPLMAPLALVSSTGGPVAAHILGTAPASSSGAVGATVGGKVMASGAAGALPLLKPVAVSGQLPIMNAQYLTTAAALGGLAHLVKPLVVVSSAPSAPNHGSSSKLPSSLAAHSEPSPPQ